MRNITVAHWPSNESVDCIENTALTGLPLQTGQPTLLELALAQMCMAPQFTGQSFGEEDDAVRDPPPQRKLTAVNGKATDTSAAIPLTFEDDWRYPVSKRGDKALVEINAMDASSTLSTWITSTSSGTVQPMEGHTSDSLGSLDRPVGNVAYFSLDVLHHLMDRRRRDLGMKAKADADHNNNNNKPSVWLWSSEIHIKPNRLLIIADAKTAHTHILDMGAFRPKHTHTNLRNHGQRLNWDAIRETYDAILFVARPINAPTEDNKYAHGIEFMTSFAPNTLLVLNADVIKTSTNLVKNSTPSDLRLIGANAFAHFQNSSEWTVYGNAVIQTDDRTVSAITVPPIWYGPEFVRSARHSSTTHAVVIKNSVGTPSQQKLTKHTLAKAVDRKHSIANGSVFVPGGMNRAVLDSYRHAIKNIDPPFTLNKLNAPPILNWLNTRDLRIAGNEHVYAADRIATTVDFKSPTLEEAYKYKMATFLHRSPGGAGLLSLNALVKDTSGDMKCELSFAGSGGLIRGAPVLPS
jgi:hypothetical protein